MVFESISKSLKSMASATSNITKKAVDTTKDIWEKALTPFDKISKSVSKHIPGFGDDRSLRDQANDREKTITIITLLTKELKKFIVTTKTVKLSISKSTAINSGIEDLIEYFKNQESADLVIDIYQQAIKWWSKQIKIAIPDTYGIDNWKASKKILLTKKQQEAITELLYEHTKKTENLITTFKKQGWLNLPELSLTPDLAHTIEVYRKEEHDIINLLIDKKYEVVTQSKKIAYLIRELERQDNNLKEHKNTITKTKIEDIVQNKIPNHLTILEQLETNIKELENKRTQSLTKVYTDQNTRLHDIITHISKNEWSSKSKKTALEKSTIAQKKRTGTAFKKFHSAHTKLWDATLKAPYEQHENISNSIHQEEELYQTLGEHQKKTLSLIRKEHIHTYSNIYLHEEKLALQKNYTYDNQLIQKTMKLQLWLINRVNKKQVRAIQDMITQTKKLNTTTIKLGGLNKSIATLLKNHEKIVKDYDTRKKTAIDTIKKIWAEIKTYTQARNYGNLSRDLSRSNIEGKMVAQKLDYIDSDITETASSIKTITEKSKLINKMMKKEKVELEDKQQTVKTTGSKKDEKIVADLEHMIQDQELTLDLIKHHLDHEQEHMNQLKEVKKEYLSQEKSLKAQLVKLTKKEKEQKKLVKNVW